MFTNIAKKLRENTCWIILAVCIFAVAVIILNYRFSAFNLPSSGGPSFDSYVKNTSWNTEFSSETPYRKGDILEYMFVFSGNSGSLFLLDTKNIYSFLNEWSFDIDGVKVENINSISVGPTPKILRIRGKVKNDGTPAAMNPKSILTIKKTQETETPKKEEIVEEKKVEVPETTSYDFSIEKSSFSVNDNALIKISGASLSLAKTLIIGEQRFPIIISWSSGYSIIPKHSFAASQQFLSILLSNGKMFAFSQWVEFYGKSLEVFVKRVTPSTVVSGQVSYIVLQGYGFSKTVSLQLGNGFVFKAANFQIIDDSVMSVEIPKDLPSWKYTFNIMDTKWVYEMTNTPLIVQ